MLWFRAFESIERNRRRSRGKTDESPKTEVCGPHSPALLVLPVSVLIAIFLSRASVYGRASSNGRPVQYIPKCGSSDTHRGSCLTEQVAPCTSPRDRKPALLELETGGSRKRLRVNIPPAFRTHGVSVQRSCSVCHARVRHYAQDQCKLCCVAMAGACMTVVRGGELPTTGRRGPRSLFHFRPRPRIPSTVSRCSS